VGLSGCLRGSHPGDSAWDLALARQVAGQYRDIFGRGTSTSKSSRTGCPSSQKNIVGMRELSRELSLPLVATNDVHYVQRTDADAQDTLMCVQMNVNLDATDKPRMGQTPEFYLKSGEGNGPRVCRAAQALESTLEVASAPISPSSSTP